MIRGQADTVCRNGLSLVLLAAAAVTVLTPRAQAQPDAPPSESAQIDAIESDVLAEILAGWERRRAAMQAIEVVLEGTVTLPAGVKTLQLGPMMPAEWRDKPFPPEDYTYPVKVRLLVDFRTNRIRTERHDQIFYLDAFQFHPQHDIWMFDGEHVQQWSPREGNTGMGYVPSDYEPELTYGKPPETSLYLTFDYEAVFLACGRLPVGSRASPDRFTQSQDPKAVEVHGRESYGGRDCIVVRTVSADPAKDMVHEYWVDVERDAAVLRARQHSFGRLRGDLEIEHEAGAAGWMPVRMVWSHYGVSDPPLVEQREVLHVTSLVASPPLDAEEFHIEPEPGMVVQDAATREQWVYHGPDDLQDVKEHHRETLLAEAHGGGAARRIIIGLMTAAVLGVGIWLVRRRLG